MTGEEWGAALLGLVVGAFAITSVLVAVWLIDRRQQRRDEELVRKALPESSRRWEAS